MRTINVTCDKCGGIFQRSISRANEAERNGWKQTCSKECKIALQTTSHSIPCTGCGKEVRVHDSTFVKSVSKQFFCSQSCSASYHNALRGPKTAEERKKISESLYRHYEEDGCLGENKKCEYCGMAFYVPRALIKRGRGRFCSFDCSGSARSGIGKQSQEEILQYIKDFHSKNGFITSKIVGTTMVHRIKKAFGSWYLAMEAAGIPVLSTRNRKRSKVPCLDGHKSDSAEEAFLDNWLHNHGIAHELDKPYPGTERMSCDFYAIEYDLWIEYLGLYNEDPSYRARYDLKKELAAKEGFSLIGILAADLRGGIEKLNMTLLPHLEDKKPLRVYRGRPGPPMVSKTCATCGNPFQMEERSARAKEKAGQKEFFCCKRHGWDSLRKP